jgi:aminotransferase
MLALVDPGDSVATPDPRYSSYDQAIGAAGGRIIEIPTGEDLHFELDADDLRRGVQDAKVLVLVNPSNPTGALVRADGVRRIAEAVRDLDITVVSDEIYEEVVYDDETLLSIATCDGMRARTVTLSGFSKAYAMTGFRVGYLIGDPAFIDAVERLKAATSGPCPLLSQNAALTALEEAPHVPGEFRRIYERRRDCMTAGLDTMGIPYGYPGGGLFIWADVSSFGVPAEEFCLDLLSQTGVLMFPGKSFGEKWEYFVRISLLAEEAKITEALDRMADHIGKDRRDAK